MAGWGHECDELDLGPSGAAARDGVGAGLLWLMLRTELHGARETSVEATRRLGEAVAALAAARALAPVVEKLKRVQAQVSVDERDRAQ